MDCETSAQRDLDEAWEIAERGPHDDLAEARPLIEKHGYWRRKEELEDAANHWPRSTT